MSTVLQTRDLRKEFDGVVATDGVNYAIDNKTLECIIGPNGAGKTTFFDLITGVLTPDSGTVEFNGDDITGLSVHEIARKGVVRKYQTPSIYNEISVDRNIRIAFGEDGTTDPNRRVKKILNRVDLAAVDDQIAGTLDHGRKQWLEIGMVLASDPSLILLDEPTAGMTTSETSRTADLITEINDKENISIITIEHDIDFVRQLNCPVTVLHNGSVLASGQLSDIEDNNEVQEVYLGR